jgi:dTDP-4-amino-4,6-dideoxygalactose transaminase
MNDPQEHEPGSAEPVPFLDLRAQWRALRDETLPRLIEVLDSQALILGPEVEALEGELARSVGSRHAIAVASGTDALHLALRSLDLGPGDEVVTSAYSFFASAGAILLAGARPVFADIDPVTFNILPASARRAIGPRTRALLPVHLYGQCAEMEPLLQLALEAGVPLVEDAAQAIGACSEARPAGSMGRLGCFSFYPTKNLGGIGDGGMIVTRDDALASRLRALRNHGQTAPYEHAELGLNSRLDALNAAALRVKLRHLGRWTEARRQRAARYVELLAATGLAGESLDEAPLLLPAERPGAWHVYNQFVVRVRGRDSLRKALQQAGVGSAVYYPRTLPLQPALAALAAGQGPFPNAEAAARETLALPIYPELTDSQQARVVELIARHFRAKVPA